MPIGLADGLDWVALKLAGVSIEDEPGEEAEDPPPPPHDAITVHSIAVKVFTSNLAPGWLLSIVIILPGE